MNNDFCYVFLTVSLIVRRLRSAMLYGQWVALSWYFHSAEEVSLKRLDKFVEMAKETIDVAGPDVLVQCFEALCYILPKVCIVLVLVFEFLGI